VLSENKKVLPITYPPITTFPGYANTLAILYSYDKTLDWIYSHYVQIYTLEQKDRKKDDYLIYEFFLDHDPRKYGNYGHDGNLLRQDWCTYLNVSEIPIELILSINHTFESIIKCNINLSNYIYSWVDVSKIKEYQLDYEFPHCILIFGYDDNEKVFHYADFINNPARVYNFSKCSYEEMEAAFHNSLNVIPEYARSMSLIKYLSNNIRGDFIFNKDYFNTMIKEYIYPSPMEEKRFSEYIGSYLGEKWKWQSYIGINVYQYLKEFAEYECSLKKDYIMPTLFHGMYDHKVMMIKRFEYFLKKGYINDSKCPFINEYEKIRDYCLAARNVVQKYNITKDQSKLYKVNKLLDNAKEYELHLLKEIFEM